MLQAKRESQVTFLHSEMLGRIPRVVHAFSTRRAETNDFSLGPVPSPNPMINLNRARLSAASGAIGWPILKLKQVHSGIVCHLEDTMAAGNPQEGDAAVTSLPEALIGVQTADCVPILIADQQSRCVAAIHAGWRGTAARIVEKTVVSLVETFGVAPEDLVAAIGPHIGVCCYEVGAEVVPQIADDAAILQLPEWPKPHLDLAIANRNQLRGAGIPDSQIESAALCTRCRADLFFSYRREGERTGRMLSIIGIAP